MSASHQVRTYRQTDFSSQTELVAQVIADHPGGISAENGAALLPAPAGKREFPAARFTARANGLMEKGRVYTTEGGGPKLYHYDGNPANWPARIARYKASKHPVTRCAEWLKRNGELTPTRRAFLEALYRETKNSLG